MEGGGLAEEVRSASLRPPFHDCIAHRAHVYESEYLGINVSGYLTLCLCIPDHSGNPVCSLMPPLVEPLLDRRVLAENLLLEEHGCHLRRSLEGRELGRHHRKKACFDIFIAFRLPDHVLIEH